ncbi:hypothetical protein JCGZ_09336 [Jatropha curcas]|uniref:Uncharacterized protein n=1 Tax=Jatropha curcas TaxID=180498 RepID=A0A067KW61_JATCU|nr:hypothetical protein JCGZ_09336 [Jatropha curcas]
MERSSTEPSSTTVVTNRMLLEHLMQVEEKIDTLQVELRMATVPEPAVPVPEKLESEPNRKGLVPVPVPVSIRLQNRRFRSVFQRIA